MTRGGKFVGGGKAPHILYRNGLYRCYTLIWDTTHKYTVGLRLGLGHTSDAAYNRWLDGEVVLESGATLYTRKL